MITYSDKDGLDFELPKMTLKLSAEMDKVTQTQTATERFRAEYEFLKKIMPSDYLSQRLEGKKMDEVDLVELSVLYHEIAAAYSKPVIEAQAAAIAAQAEPVKPTLDMIASAASIANSRQIFRRK